MAASSQTVVCVKKVKQDVSEEWDERMPLPGDIVEGVAENDADDSFVLARAKSELNSQLGKINRVTESAWLKVRRGQGTVKLKVCVIPDRNVKMQKRYTIRAASDERHIAVLADMTYEECFELQEMSRKVINWEFRGFRQRGMKYDWKHKVGSYMPDHRTTVVSSILFMPQARERITDPITVRAMAWFSAAISSGIPLIFVNIQTEQIITSDHNVLLKEKNPAMGREVINNMIVNIGKGIRLWFLPGVREISLELIPEPGEARFGVDMKRTDEGFICVNSVASGTAAERAGLGDLFEEARRTEHLLVISKLQGKSLMPSKVDSEGLIQCCDNQDIKETLHSAMERTDSIRLQIMSWPNRMVASVSPQSLAATLQPPNC